MNTGQATNMAEAVDMVASGGTPAATAATAGTMTSSDLATIADLIDQGYTMEEAMEMVEMGYGI